MIENLVNNIKKSNKIPVIYGAGKIGQLLGELLQKKNIEFGFFCVTQKADNITRLQEHDVVAFADIKKFEDCLFIIAAKPLHGGLEIFDNLLDNDIHSVLPISSNDCTELIKWGNNKQYDNWGKMINCDYQQGYPYVEFGHLIFGGYKQIRFRRSATDFNCEDINKNLSAIFESQYGNISFLWSQTAELPENINESLKGMIYSIRSVHDQVSYTKFPEWLIPLQAGSGLTDIRIADVTDNIGDNISERNRDYSETTAFYWAWKNLTFDDRNSYIGFFHYRRFFKADAECMREFSKYDFISVIPTYIANNIKSFFLDYFIPKHDWNLMLEGIKKYNSNYYDTALEYEQSHFYFANNIFCMKWEYFKEMSKFIFCVTEYIYQYYKNWQIVRNDRYMGYLVENLLSIYVMHNKERLNIATVDMVCVKKNF